MSTILPNTKPTWYQNSKQWKNNTQNYGLKRNHKPCEHQWHKLWFGHGGYLHTFLERILGSHCSILLHLLLRLGRLPIESHSYKVHTTFKNRQIPRHWMGCSSMETNDLLLEFIWAYMKLATIFLQTLVILKTMLVFKLTLQRPKFQNIRWNYIGIWLIHRQNSCLKLESSYPSSSPKST